MPIHILAAAPQGATQFWNSPIGDVVSVFLGAIGVVVVIAAILRAVTHVHKADHAKAAKLVIGAVVLAAFCFDPSLINSLISGVTTVVSAIINSVSGLANNATNNSSGGSSGGNGG